MTRRIGFLVVPLLLGSALPGCALRSALSPEVSATKDPRAIKDIETSPKSAVQIVTFEPGDKSTENSQPAAGFAPLHIKQTAQIQEIHQKEKREPAPLPLIQIPEEPKATATLKDTQEPALKAWQAMLENKYPAAVEYLRAYDEQTQSFFLRMLPVMSALTKTPMGKLPHEEASRIADQLGVVQNELRPMTGVTLGKVCFCEWVKAFGIYNPMSDDHVYSAGAAQKAGELVHLYVELKHFNSLQRARDRFETVLASSLEIRNAQGRLVRSLEFGDEKNPLVSRSPLNDYFKNYTFAVPDLEPGTYSLQIVVRDETNRALPKVASKALDFRVGPPR